MVEPIRGLEETYRRGRHRATPSRGIERRGDPAPAPRTALTCPSPGRPSCVSMRRPAAIRSTRSSWRAPGRWTRRVDLTAPLAVPPSLERLVAARLDALDARPAALFCSSRPMAGCRSALLQAVGVPTRGAGTCLDAKVVETARERHFLHAPVAGFRDLSGSFGAERRAAHQRLATALEDPVERGRHLALASDETDDCARRLTRVGRAGGSRSRDAAGRRRARRACDPAHAVDAPDDRHRRAIAAARAHREAGDGVGRARSRAEVLAQARSGAQRAEALVLASELEDVGSGSRVSWRRPWSRPRASSARGGHPCGVWPETARPRKEARGASDTPGRPWLAELLDDDRSAPGRCRCSRKTPSSAAIRTALELVEQAHALATSLAAPRSSELGRHDDGSGPDVLDGLRTSPRLADGAYSTTGATATSRCARSSCGSSPLAEFWTGRWDIAGEHADQVRDISVQYGEIPTDHLSPALIALHRGQIESCPGPTRSGPCRSPRAPAPATRRHPWYLRPVDGQPGRRAGAI